VLIIQSVSAALFPDSGPIVSGKTARASIRPCGCAQARADRCETRNLGGQSTSFKTVSFGGGHKSFDDHAYDCSGTISYVLGAAGVLASPISSTEFRSYGGRGPG